MSQCVVVSSDGHLVVTNDNQFCDYVLLTRSEHDSLALFVGDSSDINMGMSHVLIFWVSGLLIGWILALLRKLRV
jgi:hypothetical protein